MLEQAESVGGGRRAGGTTALGQGRAALPALFNPAPGVPQPACSRAARVVPPLPLLSPTACCTAR
jgi:hypothetical protein